MTVRAFGVVCAGVASAVALAGCGAFGSSGTTATTTATETSSAVPTVTVTQSATVTAPPATITPSTSAAQSTALELSSASDVAVPTGFVGTWYGHSRELKIDSDGSIRLSYRLYVNCTARRTEHCDRIEGNNIYDGGSAVAHVSNVIDATTMIMTVSETSVPKDVPYGQVRLGHDLTHHAVALFSGGLDGVPFCGAGAPDGYCGA